jgi:hypothetical protein
LHVFNLPPTAAGSFIRVTFDYFMYISDFRVWILYVVFGTRGSGNSAAGTGGSGTRKQSGNKKVAVAIGKR